MIFLFFTLSLPLLVVGNCPQWDSGACVCSPTDCDTIEDVGGIPVDGAVVFISSAITGERLQRYELNSSSSDISGATSRLTLNLAQEDQKILGFGGAFTDAATFNLLSSSPRLQSQLIKSYFGEGGLGYTLGRVPIAACDFSLKEYSYDDVENDFDLTHFSIQPDRDSGRLDFIRLAINQTAEVSKTNLTLFASPWSPPAWMKTNGRRMQGKLKGEAGDKYHKTWAEYFVKFISEFRSESIPIWGVTIQNEPTAIVPWDSNHFTAETERDFLVSDLGPRMRSEHPEVKIIIHDDQLLNIEKWAKTIIGNSTSAPFVDGVAFHWYEELDLELNIYSGLGESHKLFPSVIFLPSEACEGEFPGRMRPKIGDWTRGKRYAHDIVQDLRHGANGWTDWNLFLDMEGGPNHAGNFVDAAIVVDYKNDKFYKQPMYYVMGHFSRFIRPGAVRIESSSTSKIIETVAFVDKERSELVVILLNQKEEGEIVQIDLPSGKSLDVAVGAESILTVILALP